MTLKSQILTFTRGKTKITSGELAHKFNVSRQYANTLLKQLIQEGVLVKQGSTRAAVYVAPSHAANRIEQTLKNKRLQEHVVMEALEKKSPFLLALPENLRSIFAYAFSEMLNNAIDHSQSKGIRLDVQKNGALTFHVEDAGIGVFRNIMRKRRLRSELEAIQDLLKGKVTTQPKAHSGEGIFFTSKIADRFTLESYGYTLTIDNVIDDIFLEERKPPKKGTRVTFTIDARTKKHLNDLFRKYQADPETYAFDKTEIRVKLYTMGTIYVSRSQARRVTSGLEKFKSVILDFEHVPTIGQAFADEIFRVFQRAHPDIELAPVNMNEAVHFMVQRVEK